MTFGKTNDAAAAKNLVSCFKMHETFKVWPPQVNLGGGVYADLSGCEEVAKKWASENGCDCSAGTVSRFVSSDGTVIGFRFAVPQPPDPKVLAERERCAKSAAAFIASLTAGELDGLSSEAVAEYIRSGK